MNPIIRISKGMGNLSFYLLLTTGVCTGIALFGLMHRLAPSKNLKPIVINPSINWSMHGEKAISFLRNIS